MQGLGRFAGSIVTRNKSRDKTGDRAHPQKRHPMAGLPEYRLPWGALLRLLFVGLLLVAVLPADWQSPPSPLEQDLQALNHSLTESQRTAILLQRCWTRLRPEEMAGNGDPDDWWKSLHAKPADQLTPRQRALLEAYENARKGRADAEGKLRPEMLDALHDDRRPRTRT